MVVRLFVADRFSANYYARQGYFLRQFAESQGVLALLLVLQVVNVCPDCLVHRVPVVIAQFQSGLSQW